MQILKARDESRAAFLNVWIPQLPEISLLRSITIQPFRCQKNIARTLN